MSQRYAALARHLLQQKLARQDQLVKAALTARRPDPEGDVVRGIAGELRARFRQESVLVTEHRIGGCFIE